MFDCSGRRITVMGLGRFGGGLGVTRWLAEQGADVLLTDLDDGAHLQEPLAALQPHIDSGAITLHLGGHNVSDFTTCDLVVANPAVPRPWDNRYLRAARAAGIRITTEIEMLVERLPRRDRIIGVTGTAGKSTTSAMIAHILQQSGQRVHFGGNIGGSLLSALPGIDNDAWVVLELSSAMLHWLDGWSPHVAVVTGFAPNHLDWHGSLKHYEESKRRILRWQRAGDCVVLPEDLASRGWTARAGVHRIVIPSHCRVDGLAVVGQHNEQNAAMAVFACAALRDRQLSEQACRDRLRTFPGLPHRLEFIGEVNGARFYNDSKSTTPEATLMALNAFAMHTSPQIWDNARSEQEATNPSYHGTATCETIEAAHAIHLIAGGYDKGSDLSPISAAAGNLAGLYTIGATGPQLAAAVPGRARDCGTLEQAVNTIFQNLHPGQIVLLSPGCASWDQFVNYEDRGNHFAALVRERMNNTTGSLRNATPAQPQFD